MYVCAQFLGIEAIYFHWCPLPKLYPCLKTNLSSLVLHTVTFVDLAYNVKTEFENTSPVMHCFLWSFGLLNFLMWRKWLCMQGCQCVFISLCQVSALLRMQMSRNHSSAPGTQTRWLSFASSCRAK